MSRPVSQDFRVAVVGGGATGFAAALASARAGLDTVIFAPQAEAPPSRTAALMHGAVQFLGDLGVWPDLESVAEPMRAIRLVDDTGRLVRAPEVTFHAAEVALPAFGFNVANAVLVGALRQHASTQAGITIIATPADAIETDAGRALLRHAQGTATAELVVAADGMNSLARAAARIGVRRWAYPQTALVAIVEVERPHGGTSTEFHTAHGPFTLVPLSDKRMSVVCVETPTSAAALAALEPAALAEEFQRRSHWIHGSLQVAAPAATFPLDAALADRFAANRTALVGEAAHRLPPIGAQGLNLGLRDVAALGRMLAQHAADPGSSAALDFFHRDRRVDIRTRTLAIDALNRSLLSDFLPIQVARGLGLALAASVPIFRRALIREGLSGPGSRWA